MPTRATVPVCTAGVRVAVVSDFPAQNPAAAKRIAAAPRPMRVLFRVVMNGSSVRLAACADVGDDVAALVVSDLVGDVHAAEAVARGPDPGQENPDRLTGSDGHGHDIGGDVLAECREDHPDCLRAGQAEDRPGGTGPRRSQRNVRDQRAEGDASAARHLRPGPRRAFDVLGSTLAGGAVRRPAHLGTPGGPGHRGPVPGGAADQRQVAVRRGIFGGLGIDGRCAQHTTAPRGAQAAVVQCPGELLISVSLPFAGGSSATWASIGAALRAAAGPDWLGNILMVKPRVPAIPLPAATKAASTAPNWVSLRRWRIRLPRPMIAAISRFGGCGSG